MAPSNDNPRGRLSRTQCAALTVANMADLPGTLIDILATLPVDALPSETCCSRGGIIDASDWSLSALRIDRSDAAISARLGLFFTELVGGCNCDDDPARFSDYRVLALAIDTPSGDLRWMAAEA